MTFVIKTTIPRTLPGNEDVKNHLLSVYECWLKYRTLPREVCDALRNDDYSPEQFYIGDFLVEENSNA